MMRNLLALIAGLIVGMAVNMGLIELNTRVLHPLPAGTNAADPEQFNAYIATLPVTGFLVVMLAHLGQAFVGGWTAARLASSRPMMLAMMIGTLSLMGGIVMMTIVNPPAWMLVELPLYLIVASIAGRIEQRRRASAGA